MSRAARGLPSLPEGGSPRRRTTAACAADGELPPSMTRLTSAAERASRSRVDRTRYGRAEGSAWRAIGARAACASVEEQRFPPALPLFVRDERRLGTDRDARSSRIANGEPEPPPRQPMPAATARKAGARSSVGSWFVSEWRFAWRRATARVRSRGAWWAAVKKARRAKRTARRVESATAPSRTDSRTSCRRTGSAGEARLAQ
jgi:hypothetical protein